MSLFALYRDPVVLDSVAHRDLKLAPLTDHAMSSVLQACYLAAAEFVHAAREYVIVFVREEADGTPQVQPIVILGVTPGENLYVRGDEGSPWDARYVPALIRRYPFWTARLPGLERPAVMIDMWWKGFSRTEGDALYDDAGQPAPRLQEAIAFLEQFDLEAARTTAVCQRLTELGLLREMSANVTLPGGLTLALNDFLTIDEDALQALPDAQVLELHRNGVLALLHAHLTSLGNLQNLLERKAWRMADAPGASPTREDGEMDE